MHDSEGTVALLDPRQALYFFWQSSLLSLPVLLHTSRIAEQASGSSDDFVWLIKTLYI